MTDLIIIIVCVLLAAAGYFWRKKASEKYKAVEKPTKGMKRNKRYSLFLMIIAIYVLVVTLLKIVFGTTETRALSVTIAAERINIFGLTISTTILYSWVIMAVILVIAIILRITLIPKLKDPPKGAQNVIELVIETVLSYTKSSAHGVGELMASYIFTLALFLVGCAATELFGLRSPSADITLTGALAIMTFIITNYYGFKVKGAKGRIRSLAAPTPVIFPIRVLTDLAFPISLASRLFGNMLGGLVVMDLLYMALGTYAVGIPSVAGLYFNVFHPLIQAFIFVTLTLSFINEATE